jgi:hypothetical protein
MLAKYAERLDAALRSIDVDVIYQQFDPTRANISRAIGGVYLLIDDGEIVYVGQTWNIAQRYISHKFMDRRERKDKQDSTADQWDEIWFIPVEEEYRNEVERVIHDEFRPRCNWKRWIKNFRVA